MLLRWAKREGEMVLDSIGDTSLLLGSEDVPPVLEHNAQGASLFLLTCDHYGRLIPRSLGDLGLPAAALARHIAWDPGIAGVADALSKHLGAHLIAQRYSRLVIDCNRPPDAISSIPRISEATVIPGNERLARDLMNSGIEIRQDLIADQAGQKQWAERLARIFAEIEAALRAQGLLPV